MKKETLLDLISEVLNQNKIIGKPEEMPYEVGEAYFFRTVTYHTLGRVKNIIGDVLVLEEASWVADSGRLNEFVNDGKVYESTSSEIEPIEVEMYLHKSAICDAFKWKHELPNKVK